MTNGSLTKEFHKLLKNVDRMSDGQAKVSDWDDEDVSKFKVDIAPNGGPYCGGQFTFQIELGDNFPENPPTLIRCETVIYHPNIDPTEEYGESNICLNMFNSDEWAESFGIDDVIQGLLFLFHEPNIEDPLSPYFDSQMSEDDYLENVQLSLKGGIVEGVDYPKNFKDKEVDEGGGEVSAVTDENDTTANAGENMTSQDGENTSNGVKDAGENDLVTLTGDIKNGKAEKPVTPQPQCDAFSLFPKTKEVPSNVLYETRDDPPDVILSTYTDEPSEADVTSKPDILEHVHDSIEVKSFCWKSVSLNSFDAVIPEMNLVFTLMNNLTKSVVMKT